MSALAELWRFRDLARLLVSKELKLRYRRSILGFAWTMLNPLLTMLILSVVFSQVMRVSVENFPVFVLTALLPWNFFTQSVTGGAMSMIYNESLLRNVRVPRAVFPLSLVGSHMVNLLLALAPLFLVMLWQGVPLRPAALLFPYCLLTLGAFTAGIVLFASAMTVFFRDLGQIIEVGLAALFYLTPIIYPMSIIPEQYAWAFRLNPLYYMVVPIRSVFFDGVLPELSVLAVATGLAAVTFFAGLAFFRAREDQFLHYLS